MELLLGLFCLVHEFLPLLFDVIVFNVRDNELGFFRIMEEEKVIMMKEVIGLHWESPETLH